MFTLLRDLRKIRKQISLGKPSMRKSLSIRHCDAGSCNGCEHELSLLSSPCYDFQRYGLSIVASPRHADVLLVTGAVTRTMREPLLRAYSSMPEPRKVVALGDCAIGQAVLGDNDIIIGAVEEILPVDLTIRGCPPSPDQVIDGMLELLATLGTK